MQARVQLPAFFVNADSNQEVITASHRRLLELFESKITVRFRDAAGKGFEVRVSVSEALQCASPPYAGIISGSSKRCR